MVAKQAVNLMYLSSQCERYLPIQIKYLYEDKKNVFKQYSYIILLLLVLPDQTSMEEL
jgi:hypothetical protein